jgi:hypothetical protein
MMTTTIMISTRVKPLVLRVLVFMRMDDFNRPRIEGPHVAERIRGELSQELP